MRRLDGTCASWRRPVRSQGGAGTAVGSDRPEDRQIRAGPEPEPGRIAPHHPAARTRLDGVSGRHAAPRRAPRRAISAVLALAVALAAVVVAAGGDRRLPGTAAAATTSGPVPPPSAAVLPVPLRALPPSPARPPVDAVRVLADVAAVGGGGRVTVVVHDADGTPVVVGPDATAPVHTASLVKILVVAGLLARDASGGGAPGPEDLALMQAAMTTSDDDAMSALWVRHDGAGLVTGMAARLGLTGTAPPAVRGQWGEATTTATDVAVLLSALDEVLADADAATVVGWLRATTPTAADGFDQSFGLLSGVAAGVGAKQGWMCCVDGARQLHSAGVLADGRVVVLLGQFPRATTWAQASAALDAAAAAVLAGIG